MKAGKQNNVIRHIPNVLTVARLVMTAVFLASYLPLIYISQSQAPVSWYMPPTFSGMMDHLLRRDYSTYSYTLKQSFQTVNLGNFAPKLVLLGFYHYFVYLIQHLGLISVVLGISGIIVGLKKNKTFTFPLLLMWLLAGPILGIYMDTGNKSFQTNLFTGIAQRQYFMGEWLFMLFSGFGILALFSYFEPKLKQRTTLVYILVCLILVGRQGGVNRSIMIDRVGRETTARYAQAVLAQAQPQAIIICTSDIDCYSLLYASEVKKVRPEVTVLPHVSTYRVNWLQARPQLYPYTNWNEPDFLPQLLAYNVPRRPVYLTQGLDFYMDYVGLESGPFYLQPNETNAMPLFRVQATYPKAASAAADLKRPFTPLADKRDYYGAGIREALSNLYAYRGYLDLKYGFAQAAETSIRQALAMDPHNSQAQTMLDQFQTLKTQLKIPLPAKTERGTAP